MLEHSTSIKFEERRHNATREYVLGRMLDEDANAVAVVDAEGRMMLLLSRWGRRYCSIELSSSQTFGDGKNEN